MELHSIQANPNEQTILTETGFCDIVQLGRDTRFGCLPNLELCGAGGRQLSQAGLGEKRICIIHSQSAIFA